MNKAKPPPRVSRGQAKAPTAAYVWLWANRRPSRTLSARVQGQPFPAKRRSMICAGVVGQQRPELNSCRADFTASICSARTHQPPQFCQFPTDWINASASKPPPAGSVQVLARAGEDLGEAKRKTQFASQKCRAGTPLHAAGWHTANLIAIQR